MDFLKKINCITLFVINLSVLVIGWVNYFDYIDCLGRKGFVFPYPCSVIQIEFVYFFINIAIIIVVNNGIGILLLLIVKKLNGIDPYNKAPNNVFGLFLLLVIVIMLLIGIVMFDSICYHQPLCC